MTRISLRPVAPKISGALAAIILSAATLLGPFAAAPAQAAPGGGYYQATLASALAEPKMEILNGVMWHCAEDSCTGNRSGSRPVIVCGRLAHHVGEIARFSAAGDALDAKDLAACNKG